MDHQFRSAAIGGFHKQDVLDYLELIVKEHAAQTQQLQEQLDQALAQCAAANEQADRNAAQAQQLQQENRQLQQQADQTRQQLEQSQAEAASLRTQLSQAERQRQDLQYQVDKLLPDATAYIAVKDRTAGMELDAHRRAQGVLDQAQEEAVQLHNQMKQWLARVNRQYNDLRTQIDGTITDAAAQLNKAGTLLHDMSNSLKEQDTTLTELEKTFGKCDPINKVPAPMPIPEE